MKKINIILMTLIFTMCFVINVMGANRWINLELEYDGKIHTYSAEEINIIINDKEIQDLNIEPVIINDRALVPLRDVFEELDSEINWDNETRQATIIYNNNKVTFTINSDEIVKNDKEIIKIDTPAKIINDYTMVPIRAISTAIGYDVVWDNETREVIIKLPDETIKEEITEETTKDETIKEEIIETNNNGMQKKDGIKILWDQTYPSMNDKEEKRQKVDGLDVISPTWFAIKDNDGNIEDKGSIEYAKWAKRNGYDIWGLVTNSFDAGITKAVLSSPQKRQKVIDQMLEYADKYMLDGINIDFEAIGKENGDIYLQFIQEATPIFKEAGLVVSVDMLVPAPWNDYYHMEEVGEIVDYVIVMVYDEHYRTSKESGSTASLGWSEKYMDIAIQMVDEDKLIMGVPFYTRLWGEKINPDGSIEVMESIAVTMEQVEDLIVDKGIEPVWLEDIGQHFIQYEEDGLTYKLWIENEKSMEERMKLSREYDVAGIAAWKRGYESDGIWDIINKYYE